MQRKSPEDRLGDCRNHLQSIIKTYKPALEMLISRLICRHPNASKVFLALKKDKELKKGRQAKKKESEQYGNDTRRKVKGKEEILPIYKGIADIYVLEGWEQKCAMNTVFVITIPHWFAEAVNLLDIADVPRIEAEFDIDNEHVLISVAGTVGLSRFMGDFIPFLKEQFGRFDMPRKCGLDTQLLGDAAYLHRRFHGA